MAIENPTNITFSESGDSTFQNVYIYGKLNYDFDNDDITVKSLNVTGVSNVTDLTVSGNLNVTGSNTKIGQDIVTRNLKVTGIATISSIKDNNGSTGSAGQVLSTDGNDLEWINTSSANVNSASKVGVNDSSNSGDKMYITFVDATSGNEEIRVGTGITYAPSSDKLYVKNIASPAGNLELQAVSGENGIVIKDNNAVELYYDGSATWKLATKSDGVEIRDRLYIADNDEIRFGNGNDLKISHTNDLSGQNDSNGDSVLAGTDWCSYIKETGTGPLVFKSDGGPSSGAFQWYDAGWRPILKLFSGSSARAGLYYAGAEKLVTSSTGVTVTGTVNATSFSGSLPASNLTGALPAISGANLTGIEAFVTGMILLWYGNTGNIPSGFVLCDGNNSTPDLRDRFVIGAGSAYSPGNTGGSSSVTLSTSQLPSHNHSLSASGTTGGGGSHRHYGFANATGGQQRTGSNLSANNFAAKGTGAGNIYETYNITTAGNDASAGKTSEASSHTHSFSLSGNTGSAGSGSSIENRPPYYALCYIMKT